MCNSLAFGNQLTTAGFEHVSVILRDTSSELIHMSWNQETLHQSQNSTPCQTMLGMRGGSLRETRSLSVIAKSTGVYTQSCAVDGNPENRGSRKNLARPRNLGNVSTESRRLVFFLVWFRNSLSLGRGFSNKGLGVSVSIRFYHSPPLILGVHDGRKALFQ